MWSEHIVRQATRSWLLACSLIVAAPLLPLAQLAPSAPAAGAEQKTGQHDFDFEFGTWNIQLSRLLKPLTGSQEWAEYEGTSVVRRVWDGRANLGELDVTGPRGRIVGLSLRLYNPESRQWHISWASSSDGLLGPAMIGGFANGRGEFYNQEMFNGRAIFVRFIFSDITPTSFKLEQAFSDDGGRRWEANWIASFTKAAAEPAKPR